MAVRDPIGKGDQSNDTTPQTPCNQRLGVGLTPGWAESAMHGVAPHMCGQLDRGGRPSLTRSGLAVSLCLDVHLADSATVFVVFRAKKTTEARGTYPYWKEPLGDKLLLQRLQRGGEPPGEL
jgi:hypothetical protein